MSVSGTANQSLASGDLAHSADPVRPSWKYYLSTWVLLAVATVIAYGWTIDEGLVLDDHWHHKCLAEIGWSVGDLLETTTIDPENLVDHWWQEKPIRFQYARPFSVLLMKTVHVPSAGKPAAQHTASLVLHILTGCLVQQLCLVLTRRRFWAFVGGLLFILYPLNVFAVGWLAAQNTILQTALILGALLCYIRASGGGTDKLVCRCTTVEHEHRRRPKPERSGFVRATQQSRDPGDSSETGTILGADVHPLRVRLLAASLLLWVLALLSRENAIVLPAILLAFDWVFGGRAHVRARYRVYLLLAAIGAAYLVWRFAFFYQPMPDVYVRRPDGPGYVLWLVAKLMHYLCCSVWPAPMVVGPTGRFHPFTEVPGDVLLMAAILAVMGTAYYLSCRRIRGWWIWPTWILLAVLPVLPILATPHSGYLCGVGFAVGVVLGPASIRSNRRFPLRHWRTIAATLILVVSGTFVMLYWLLWKGMILAERFTSAPLVAEQPPEQPTDLFFINLPFTNIYSKLCLEEAWGPAADNARCHVLVYSPLLERMEQRCVVEQLDAQTLRVSVEGRPYFSGLLGRFLIDAMRQSGPFRTGQTITGQHFTIRIDDADGDGVKSLTFVFPRPLTDESYRFYLTSFECGACRLTFRSPDDPLPTCPQTPAPHGLAEVTSAADALKSGQAAAGRALLAGMTADDVELRSAAAHAFLPVARLAANATAALVQPIMDTDDPGPDDIERIRRWWCESIDDDLLSRLAWNRDEMMFVRQQRDEITRGRGWAAKVIHTDLYLTGPPFPGPR